MQNHNEYLLIVLLLPFLLAPLNSFAYSSGTTEYSGVSADILIDSQIFTNFVDTVKRESFISIPVIYENQIREVT